MLNLTAADIRGFKNIAFENKFDAEMVLTALRNVIIAQKHVSVKEYYIMCGYPDIPQNVTDQLWDTDAFGWTSLRQASVRKNEFGQFYISFPPFIHIEPYYNPETTCYVIGNTMVI